MPGYQIHIVDQEATTRVMLKKILTANGCEVSVSSDGESCFQFDGKNKPDVILLDTQVKGSRSGFEICEALKHNDDTCDMPVIFVTALNDQSSLLKALRVGAADYIMKPVNPTDVKVKIERVIKAQNLLKDKMTLLRLTEGMVKKLQGFLDELSLTQTLDTIKSDVAEESTTVFDRLESVREKIKSGDTEGALKGLLEAESSLQFADRVSQQLNEFAKIIQKINHIIHDKDGATGVTEDEEEAIDHASTDSVLHHKVDQGEVDDLLDSLGI